MGSLFYGDVSVMLSRKCLADRRMHLILFEKYCFKIGFDKTSGSVIILSL